MKNNSNTKINKIYSQKIITKRNSRLCAVQLIYSYLVRKDASKNSKELLRDILEYRENYDVDPKYTGLILMGATEKLAELQNIIEPHLLEGWKFNRLGKVIQAILLASSYEIIFIKKLEDAIIINEYLEIAKTLNHEGEAGFINSVLDGIAQNQL